MSIMKKRRLCEIRCKQFPLKEMGEEYSSKFTENFYVIQFDDGIALVPNNWLRISDDKKQQVCFYPNYTTKKRLNKAIQTKEMPDLKNEQAGWTIYDVLRIFASADTFERGQEKLRMAENISDINTEDEENIKQTRHDRAVAKIYTSDDEFSDTEVISSLLSPFPDPKEFSGSELQSKKPARILATYERPIISPDKIQKVESEKNKTERIVRHKKKELKENQKDFIGENINYSSDECNELIELKNDKDLSLTVLKNIFKKINRISIDISFIEKRLKGIENKINITGKDNNMNIIEEGFTFDTISSIHELQLLEQNLENEEFFIKMKSHLKLKGGTNLQDIIKNIFKTLIKDEILMLYSWKGARGKNAFRNFKIVSLIIAVVRLHDTHSTEDIITKVMINWIVQAPARVRRIVNKQQNQNMDDEDQNLLE